MAPPKTSTTLVGTHNNNNTNNTNNIAKQQAKPRKRKPNTNGKQQQVSGQANQEEPIQPGGKAILVGGSGVEQVGAKQTGKPAANNKQQVPSIVKEPSKLGDKKSPIGKQLSAEETDDIDAGIELDGSSNSGSSVKDMSEDQLKSASASPVMAAEAAPASSNKKSTTKQQLAANQNVIDADEELLQQKLQKEKMKKLEDSNGQSAADRKMVSAGSKPAPAKRRLSTQSSTESASGLEGNQSVCKVCNQHVYQMERMLAEKSLYHKRCFRCLQCKIQLRVDSYSSHEGQVYCKTHHRQLFQPQVKLDNEEDVDIVAKSSTQTVDNYLLQRGRLSELSFLFLQPKAEEARQRQMIICENEPKELPKDVVRSDTKLDDGIEQLNLNLGNILQKFERGQASNLEEPSPPSSAGVVIEKPSVNIRQTLRAFESMLSEEEAPERSVGLERPVVRKLANINEMFLKKNSEPLGAASPSEQAANGSGSGKPLPMKRSESLMLRLKKYESRIAGEQVEEDESDSEREESSTGAVAINQNQVPRKLTSINLSSLKSQWENGDINNRKSEERQEQEALPEGGQRRKGSRSAATSAAALEIAALRRQHMNSQGDIMDSSNNDNHDHNDNHNETNNQAQSVLEKEEELCRIREQLASRKKVGGESVRNIYENAIREAQEHTNNSINKSRRDSSDLSALNGTSRTNEIQQQLLKQVRTSYVSNDVINFTNINNQDADDSQQQLKTPTTPNKDHFQLNLSNRANKLKEKFELGLINNSSRDDSDGQSDEEQEMSKLDQIRQEKMEDLSVFTEGEIKAREARSLFQQIDRRISAAANASNDKPKPVASSRSLASIGASMRTKLTNQMNAPSNGINHHEPPSKSEQQPTGHPQELRQQQQPIRLTNNVKT